MCIISPLGYRQAMDWLLGVRASGRPAGVGELCALHVSICQATHKLVRAQMTWFRWGGEEERIAVGGAKADGLARVGRCGRALGGGGGGGQGGQGEGGRARCVCL